MKKLYMARENPEAELLTGLLEQRGIACSIRNESVLNAMGPLVFCYPEVWILNDDDFPAAQQILEDWQTEPSQEQTSWKCPECGEEIDAQFDACWRCAGKTAVTAETHADNEEA